MKTENQSFQVVYKIITYNLWLYLAWNIFEKHGTEHSWYSKFWGVLIRSSIA
jgi:hypothetical protein